MENAGIAITRAVEGEHLRIFSSQSVFTRTDTTEKHRGVHPLEPIKKMFPL